MLKPCSFSPLFTVGEAFSGNFQIAIGPIAIGPIVIGRSYRRVCSSSRCLRRDFYTNSCRPYGA